MTLPCAGPNSARGFTEWGGRERQNVTTAGNRMDERNTMAEQTPWQQVLRYENRANPYPFYAELRKTPVSRQPDGSYVISTYREIVSILHDPRVSSDMRKRLKTPSAADQASP